jgi:hypothetical protein
VALPPEDAVLIQVGAAETPEVKKKKANVREKPSTSVSWLRRHTEYISDYEQSTKKVSRADSIEARYPTTRPDPTPPTRPHFAPARTSGGAVSDT